MAVLGALSVEPMTGYQVHAGLRDVLGNFWTESFGQIYPTLHQLEADGLVERRGGDGAAKALFAITKPGLAALKLLLAEPIQQSPQRNGLMLRVFFGRQLGKRSCRALIEQAGRDAQAELARFAQLRALITSDDQYAKDRPYWLLTVAAGEHGARAALAWSKEATRTIDSWPQQRAR